jgi:hypothetical protein
MKTGVVWLIAGFAAAIGCAGCGSDNTAPPTEISLRKLASFYGRYISTHKGSGPKNEAELRAFIKEQSPEIDIDDLFRSARDGQRYVVVYLGAAQAAPGTVVAYEKEGKSGKRFVAFSTTEVRELDDDGLKQALAKR